MILYVTATVWKAKTHHPVAVLLLLMLEFDVLCMSRM